MAFQRRYDLALAGISALLVAGAVMNAFGVSAYLVSLDRKAMWLYWAIGTGLWWLAAVIFMVFMDHPLPRHSRRR